MIRIIVLLWLILETTANCLITNCATCTFDCDSCPEICTLCNTHFVLQNHACVYTLCSMQHCSSCEHGSCKSCSVAYKLNEGNCTIDGLFIGEMVLISTLVIAISIYTVYELKMCVRKRSPSLDLHVHSSNLITFQNFDRTRDLCGICLETNCNAVTSCDHYFHLHCISEWLNKRDQCPLCKTNHLQDFFIVECMKCKLYTQYHISKPQQLYHIILKPDRHCEECKYSQRLQQI